MPHRIAIIGYGKIAQDQHRPAILADPRFELCAIVDPVSRDLDVPCFAALGDLLAQGPAVDAVAICTPPHVRGAIAREAVTARRHVLLEKPPAATPGAALELAQTVTDGSVLYASWHSRHAPMIAAAKAWLVGRMITGGELIWREDAHRWHPGQHWLWQPGGLGVFDPTINAFSILTEISDLPWTVSKARFQVPAGLHAPIAAQLVIQGGDAVIDADLHFHEDVTAEWTIRLATDAGTLELCSGGAMLTLPGEATREQAKAEYAGVYDHFATLIEQGRSDVDVRPLQMVADAFLVAEISGAPPFRP